jgi:6-phosphogluconate dehydrogenase
LNDQNRQIGLIGLGVMGRNLAMNLRDHGTAVHCWDPWAKARDWQAENINIHDALAGMVDALSAPRMIIVLVKAGEPVDAAVEQLRLLLKPDDAIIDCGNSHFGNTQRRSEALSPSGLHFAGIGVSGGAEGARHGPAMMAGCDETVWQRLRLLFEPIAARTADGEPCVGWYGTDGAGHFVKMVHNGVEYAVMQAISETCHALHFGGGLPHDQISDLLAGTDQGYLVEITREILTTTDADDGLPLIDRIGDDAGQKGTGGWCVEASMQLGAPVPVIAEAVAQRQLSSGASRGRDRPVPKGLPVEAFGMVGPALDAATAVALQQGFGLAQAASAEHDWQITAAGMAAAWRAGSILRMPVLDDILRGKDDLDPLLEMIDRGLPALRAFTVAAQQARQPVPVLASALAWADARDLGVLPTRMVQAQRDRFGDHGFRRTDRPGTHHGPWNRTGA